MMTNMGIMELIIPAMLLLTLVSAIGNRNIGMKFPVTAAKMSHFKYFRGNFLIFKIAIGNNKIPAIKTRKAQTS